MLHEEFETAHLKAPGETGLPEERFPVACPYSIDQVLDEAFFPDEP